MTDARPGVWAAALTPLQEDLSVDLPALVGHLHWLLANGCDGVAVLGTTGEANSFSVAERRAIIEAAASAGLDGGRTMIGTGCCALADTLELSRAALDAGFDNLLMLPPFYYKGVSADGLFASYAEVIQRLASPRARIYVYDFPKMTGLEIDTALIERLHAAYPETIVGMKDSSGRWEDMADVLRAVPGFGLYAGSEEFLLDTLKAGGPGCISATGNVTSMLCQQVYREFLASGEAASQDELTALRRVLQAHPASASLKGLMAQQTGRPGWNRLRPPLLAMDDAALARLHDDVAAQTFALASAA